METTTIPDYPQDVRFEQMLISLQDLTQEEKEAAVMNYWLGLTFKQRDSMTFEQTEKLKCINRHYDELTPDFGDIYEHEIPQIVDEKFDELGYQFNVSSRRVRIFDSKSNKPKLGIDLLLENDDTLMAVEIRQKPDEDDITYHIKQLEILRDFYRSKNDMRQVEGAIAGAIFGELAKKAAIKAGLYVIEQTGDTVKIEVPQDFVPRKW